MNQREPGAPPIGWEMEEEEPAVSFEDDLFKKWQTGELPSELLEAAGVPAYPEWVRATTGTDPWADLPPEMRPKQVQLEELPPEMRPKPIQEHAPKDVKMTLTEDALTPKTKAILQRIGYKIPERPTVRFAKAGEKAALGDHQALITVQPKGIAHKAFVAGWGDVLATAGAGAKWLGAEGMAQTLSEGGEKLQRVAPEDDLGPFQWAMLADPRFWAHRVTRTVPFTMSLIPAAIIGAYGGGAAAGAVGLGAFGTMILSSIGAAALSRPIESFFEAAGTYDEALERGMAPEDAEDAAEEVFWKNMTLALMDAGEFLVAFAPGGTTVRIGRSALLRTARVGGKVTIVGLSEAGEEGIQEVFQRQALGLPVELDAEMQQAMAIGGIFGFGLGGGGEVFTMMRERVKEGMTAEQRQRFEAVKARLKEVGRDERGFLGYTDDGAELGALDDFAETEEGAAAIEGTVEEIIKEESDKERQQPLDDIDATIENIDRALIDLAKMPEPGTPSAAQRRTAKAAQLQAERARYTRLRETILGVAEEPAQAGFTIGPAGEIIPTERRIVPGERERQMGMRLGEMGIPTEEMPLMAGRPTAQAIWDGADTKGRARLATEAGLSGRVGSKGSWDKLSADQQAALSKVVPPAEPTIQQEGEAIAAELGLDYGGPQMDTKGKFAFHTLTDPETGTTLAATSLEEARTKLAESREKFKAAPAVEAPEPAATAAAAPRGEVVEEGGTITKAFAADARTAYEFQFNIVELDDLITSHTEAFEWNPKFPKELQQRIRERAASRAQVNEIAWNLEPDVLLRDTGMLDAGPPIIGRDNVVESGNARVMALRVAPKDRRVAYRARLLGYAEAYGISRERVDKMKFPVLVRTRISEVDRAEFASAANVPVTMALSTFEQGLADAGRLSDAAVASLDIAEGETIEAAVVKKKNERLVGAFLEGVPRTERAALADARGRLSQAGVTRLKVALISRTYSGAAGQVLTQVFVESTDPGIKQIESALLRTLGVMAQAEALVQAGERAAELSVTEDLAKVVRVYADLKLPESAFKTISDYLAQTGFDRPLNEVQLKLLGHLEDIGNKPKLLRDFMADLANRIIAAPSPAQIDMFPDMVALTKDVLVDQAIAGHREELNMMALEQAKVIAPPLRAAPELTYQEETKLDIIEDIVHAHEINERRLRALTRRAEADPEYSVLVPREFAEEEGAREPAANLIEQFEATRDYLADEMTKQIKALDRLRKQGREPRPRAEPAPKLTAEERAWQRAREPEEVERAAWLRRPVPLLRPMEVRPPLAPPPPPMPATVGSELHLLKLSREKLIGEILRATGHGKQRLQFELEHMNGQIGELEAGLPKARVTPMPTGAKRVGGRVPPPRPRPPMPGQQQLGSEPPRPGAMLIAEQPEIDDIIAANYAPNRAAEIGAKIAKVPWIGKFIASFNPMITAMTWAERAAISWVGLLDFAPSSATTAMHYVRGTEEAFSFEKDRKGRRLDRVLNVVPKVDTYSLSIWDILTYPERYHLNSAQVAEAELLYQLLEEQRALEIAAGVKEPQLVGDIGFHYFPRFVRALRDVMGEVQTEIRQGVRRRPGARQAFQLRRLYESAWDGIISGKDYGVDYRGAVEMRLTAGQKAIADRKLIEYLKRDHIGGRIATQAVEDAAAGLMSGGDVMREFPARRIQREPIIGKEGTIWLAGLNNRIYPIDTAQQVNDIIRGELKSSQLLMTLNKANAVARMGQTAIDLGYGLIQLQLTLVNDPAAWGRAMGMAVEVLMDPKAYSRWAKEHKTTQHRMMQHGAAPFTGTEFTEAIRPGGWLAKAPIVGGLFTRFGVSFDAAIDVSRTMLFEAFYDVAASEQEITDITNMVDNMVGIASSRRLGVTQLHRQAETFALYAPRYFRSMVGFIIDAFQGGVRGSIARKSLVKFAVGSAMFMSALAMALGQEDRLKPTKENPVPKMFDPRTGEFMTVEIGGAHVGLGGAYVAAMRLLGALSRAAIEDPKDFISFDPHENPILRYGYGRFSPILGGAVDIATGHNYLGERLDTPWDYGRELIDKTFPFWLAGAITDVPRAGWAKAMAEWWGLRAWMVQYWEQAERFADDHISEIPGHMILDYQREAWTKGELRYDDLNNGQRAWLLQEYEEYEKLRDQAKAQRVERGTNFEVAEAEATEALRTTFNKDMEAIAKAYLRNEISAWQYQNQRTYLRRIRSGEYQMLETMRLMLDADRQEGLERWLEENEKPEDKALDEYFEITTNPVSVGGVPDWNATYRLADDFLRTLPDDVAEYVERHQDDWIKRLGPYARRVETEFLERPRRGRGIAPRGVTAPAGF